MVEIREKRTTFVSTSAYEGASELLRDRNWKKRTRYLKRRPFGEASKLLLSREQFLHFYARAVLIGVYNTAESLSLSLSLFNG